MKFFGTIFFLILLFSCGTVKNKKNDITLTEVNYGLYKGKNLYNRNNKKSPSGVDIVSKNNGFYEKTNKVPLKFGISFGSEFILNSSSNKIIKIETVWKYPKKIKNDEGKYFSELRKTSSKRTNEKKWTGYVINRDYEMVKGKWVLEIYHDNKRLYKKKFFVE
jgi:hypothetical protein